MSDSTINTLLIGAIFVLVALLFLIGGEDTVSTAGPARFLGFGF